MALTTSFKDTRLIYIETRSMQLSARLAKIALKKDWIGEWLELPGRMIIIAKTIAGRINQIEEIN